MADIDLRKRVFTVSSLLDAVTVAGEVELRAANFTAEFIFIVSALT